MSFNFKKYGNVDITNIKNSLQSLDWEAYTFRQEKHPAHVHTKTVPLIWDETGLNIVQWKDYKQFNDDFEKIKSELEKYLGPGEIKSALLINLLKNSSIDRHVDAGEYFGKNNRIHIPIVTNEKCIFEVDGEEVNMKEGEIWEINNNDKPHSVTNNGEDRVHLLIDWYPHAIKRTKSLF